MTPFSAQATSARWLAEATSWTTAQLASRGTRGTLVELREIA